MKALQRKQKTSFLTPATAVTVAAALATSTGCTLESPRGILGGLVNFGGISSPNPHQPPPPQAPSQDTQSILQAADRTLRSQGYQPTGPALSAGVQYRGMTAFPINAVAGACYAVFIIGNAGVAEVDMQVYSPTGRPVAEDQGEPSRPYATFCAQENGTHFARVFLYRGQGTLYFGSYQGPPGSAPNFATALRTPVPGAELTAPDPATAQRIEQFRAQLGANGYRPSGGVTNVTLLATSRRASPVPLQGGWCYAFGAFGGEGVRDADLEIFQTGSRRPVRDMGSNVDAAVADLCLTENAQVNIRPIISNGRGAVWMAVLARPLNQAAGTPPQQVATVRTETLQGPGEADPLETGYLRLSRQLISLGYESVGDPFSENLAAQGSNSLQVNLEGGRCFAIAAVGGNGITDLDLSLLDASNAEVDREYAVGTRSIVRACPTASGAFTVRTNAAQGQGPFRMGLFRWTSGTSAAGVSGILFVRNAELSRVLEAEGYEGDPTQELFRGRLRQGGEISRTINLQQGTCYSVVAVGGAGVQALSLTLQQGRTAVSEAPAPTAFPEVRHCATQTGAHRAVITAVHGAGDVVFRVFRRTSTPNTTPAAPR